MKIIPGKTAGFLAAMILIQMLLVSGQSERVTDDPADYINDRLSRSRITKISSDGQVFIKSPGEKFEFNLMDTVFNYNGLNGDHRVRILGEYCIESYDSSGPGEATHRQSFLCESRKAANEVVDALWRLKRRMRDDHLRTQDRSIDGRAAGLECNTVSEAIEFINRNLTRSAIIKSDADGVMIINAPDCLYKVDLRRTEFMFNDLSRDPRVRFYGEWSLSHYQEDGRETKITRESFDTTGRKSARQIITALYLIKGACTGMGAAEASQLRNVTGTRTNSYHNIQEAIDYINDRLEISVILHIDRRGKVTVNASESIYQFDLTDCEFDRGRQKDRVWGILRAFFNNEEIDAVEIRCPDGMERYDEERFPETVDFENFQCRSSFAVREVIEALEYLKKKF